METVLRVFIADDSAPVRDRLAALISELRAVELVGQAENAGEAIEAIQRLQPDVVILDIRIAGGNGFHVLEGIKRRVAAPAVIMLAAFPYPQYREKCLEAGAECLFDKTTEFDRVAGALEQFHQNKVRERPALSGEGA